MKVRFFIPGRFEDAFLYMDRVAALGEDHTLHIYNLKRYISSLSSKQRAAHSVLTYGLLKSNAHGKRDYESRLAKSEKLRSAISRLAGQNDTVRFEVDAGLLDPAVHDIGLRADIVLDVSVYFRRLYLATNKGLFHLDIDWEPRDAVPVGSLIKRLDAHCLSTTAKYATVSASCGDEGLFAAPDDFSWYANGGIKRLQQLASKSLHSAWLTRNLVNYDSYRALPGLFRGEVTEVQAENEKRHIVTEFNENGSVRVTLWKALRDVGVAASDIRATFNSNFGFLVQTHDDQLYVVEINPRWQTARPSAISANGHDLATRRILSMHGLRSGLVLETDSEVLLLTDGNLSTLVDSEAVAVRTFPASRHHEDVVAVITEDGLELVGLLDM